LCSNTLLQLKAMFRPKNGAKTAHKTPRKRAKTSAIHPSFGAKTLLFGVKMGWFCAMQAGGCCKTPVRRKAIPST
jgi:hypothetical protein